MEAPLLNALQKAPALLSLCKSAGLLKQLRGVRRTSRRLATTAITTVTIHLGHGTQQADLLRMMPGCKLAKVVLVASKIGALPMSGGRWYLWPSAASNGTTLIKWTRRLTTALGPVLGSLTRLELFCIDQPRGSSTGEVLAADTASILQNFTHRCPALSHLIVHASIQAGFNKTRIPSQGMLLKVETLVTQSKIRLLTQLTHLEVDAYMWKGTVSRANILEPLDNADMAAIGQLSNLAHLKLGAGVTQDLTWNALPHTLQSLELTSVAVGPRPGTSLPNLRLIKLRGDCAARELALLLCCSLVIEAVHVRDLTAVTWPQNLNHLRTIQDFNNNSHSPAHSSLPHSDLLDTSMGRRSSVGDNLGPGGAIVIAVAVRECSPSVHARRIKLLSPETDGLTHTQFLQQMPPMPGYAFCSIARPITGLPAYQAAADPFFSQVHRVFPDVRSLLVKRCSLLETDLLALGQCENLQAVHLGGCAGLSGTGLVTLAKTAGKLLVLEAHGCPKVSILSKFTVQDTLKTRVVGQQVEERAGLLQVQNSRKCRGYYRKRDFLRAAAIGVALGLRHAKHVVERRIVIFVTVRVLRVPRARACKLVDSGYMLQAGVDVVRQVTGL